MKDTVFLLLYTLCKETDSISELLVRCLIELSSNRSKV